MIVYSLNYFGFMMYASQISTYQNIEEPLIPFIFCNKYKKARGLEEPLIPASINHLFEHNEMEAQSAGVVE